MYPLNLKSLFGKEGILSDSNSKEIKVKWNEVMITALQWVLRAQQKAAIIIFPY